jgi:hypothetical protein
MKPNNRNLACRINRLPHTELTYPPSGYRHDGTDIVRDSGKRGAQDRPRVNPERGGRETGDATVKLGSRLPS